MANPQTENGFTGIANELLEAFSVIDLNGYESKFIFALIRRTYGFKKKTDYISNSQFVEATKLYKAHISRTETNLIRRKIVTKIGKQIGLNKNWEQWTQKDGVTRIGNSVTRIGNKKLPEMVDTKETIQKKLPAIAGLEDKKKKMKPYQEPSIDIETGELIKETDNGGKVMKELIAWAEKRRGGKFLNFAKQMTAISKMKNGGYDPDEIKERWQEMEKDDFWKEKGLDFMSVVGSFSRKPLKNHNGNQ
jgi:phage replication O-like protein O